MANGDDETSSPDEEYEFVCNDDACENERSSERDGLLLGEGAGFEVIRGPRGAPTAERCLRPRGDVPGKKKSWTSSLR